MTIIQLVESTRTDTQRLAMQRYAVAIETLQERFVQGELDFCAFINANLHVNANFVNCEAYLESLTAAVVEQQQQDRLRMFYGTPHPFMMGGGL